MSTLSKTSPSAKDFSAPQISVVFMGTPEFAATALNALISESYHIVGVVTQPDRKVGRKQVLTASPVKLLAEQRAIPIFQPERLHAEAVATLASWKPDIIVVAAYGRILPKAVLTLPGFGCINIHASLLPRWRGASPVANALMAGDTKTGVTLMELNEGLDTGGIIAQEAVAIDPHECAPALLSRLATAGAQLLVKTLPLWISRQVTAVPQTNDGVTLCQLIDREDGHIFWNETAEVIYNRYRGLTPWPGVFTFWKRDTEGALRLKLLELSLQKTALLTSHPSGTVIEAGEKVGICTGSGVIFPLRLQLEGKEAVSIQEFISGYPDFIGSVLL